MMRATPMRATRLVAALVLALVCAASGAFATAAGASDSSLPPAARKDLVAIFAKKVNRSAGGSRAPRS